MVCLKLDQVRVLDHYRGFRVVLSARRRLDQNMERALTTLRRLIQRFEAPTEIERT